MYQAKKSIQRHSGDCGSSFEPTAVLIATWFKVSSYFNSTLQNTFQAVLATDEQNTFAIFNIKDIEWTYGWSENKVRYQSI